ncbi:winged helix-turn-helix domain-containing protein [Serratia proteamaculans]|uniref:winged helix-turn-helix domain-containing protein n=1 Tax=Serratia proteamaculans TaxID=28151 RepID=UPI00217BD0CB|nr:helix-turn-helix domain-containing protein [Serratia proteamaculans]CAI1130325.1 phosphate regulon transcriptional regulatory protein PhoB [Serratia proteamaculans]
MKFIINKRLKYHEDRSTIEAIDDNMEPIALTTTLNRLLALLVKNNNVLLTREHILTQVWDDHGQTASNNNLNNYISMLRKILATLGEEDIISTLPRQGFMFNAAEINTIDSDVFINSEQHEPNQFPDSSDKEITPITTSKKPIPMILLCFLFIASLALPPLVLNTGGYKKIDEKSIGMVGKCNVKVAVDYHNLNKINIDYPALKNKLSSWGINCASPAVIYYYSSNMLSSATTLNNVFTFYSYCPLPAKGNSEVKCENYYEKNA